MDYAVYFIVGVVLLFLVVKILSWPIRILWKLVINAILGAVLLVVVNFIGKYLGFNIGINIWTALVAGFFGVPGIIFLIIFKLFL